MELSDFDFKLPAHLIAQYPPEERGNSRLLTLMGSMAPVDSEFLQLPKWLQAGDLLIINDTRVLPARLFGHKESGGKVEILLERVLAENQVMAQISASRAPKVGSVLYLQEKARMRVLHRQGAFYRLFVDCQQSLEDLLGAIGHMPLPPYIHRRDESIDKDRYQTIFASQPGAVAAPTAGLHMTQALLDTLTSKAVELASLTLHVGAGTFQPIRSNDFRRHQMHREQINVSETLCQKIRQTRQQGGRIVALGTTSLRALESAAAVGGIRPVRGETDIFIYPGFEFKVVDLLITNFHLPRSSLLLLVSAFAGIERIRRAYQHAVEKHYRFYSYGDAMLIDKSRMGA